MVDDSHKGRCSAVPGPVINDGQSTPYISPTLHRFTDQAKLGERVSQSTARIKMKFLSLKSTLFRSSCPLKDTSTSIMKCFEPFLTIFNDEIIFTAGNIFTTQSTASAQALLDKKNLDTVITFNKHT